MGTRRGTLGFVSWAGVAKDSSSLASRQPLSHPESSSFAGLRPCVAVSTTSTSSETPRALAASSSAPTTALDKLPFSSLHGHTLARSLSAEGVRRYPDNSFELPHLSA